MGLRPGGSGAPAPFAGAEELFDSLAFAVGCTSTPERARQRTATVGEDGSAEGNTGGRCGGGVGGGGGGARARAFSAALRHGAAVSPQARRRGAPGADGALSWGSEPVVRAVKSPSRVHKAQLSPSHPRGRAQSEGAGSPSLLVVECGSAINSPPPSPSALSPAARAQSARHRQLRPHGLLRWSAAKAACSEHAEKAKSAKKAEADEQSGTEEQPSAEGGAAQPAAVAAR